MNPDTLDALRAVADLLGNEVTVASIPGRETVRIVGNRLLELSAFPDKAEGWRGAFQMMRRTGIINAEQQQILDDAYQRGGPPAQRGRTVDAGQRARRCCGFFRLEQSPGTGMGVPVLHGEKISPQRGRRADI